MAIVAILAIIVLVAFFPQTPTDYVQCNTTNSQQPRQHLRFSMFIRLGEGKELNVTFIPIPENMGLGYRENLMCQWPIYTLTKQDTGEYGTYYTRVHVQSSFPVDKHEYTLADVFDVWGEWNGYNSSVYFGRDGVSYYRSEDVDLLVHRGPVIDPYNSIYSSTSQYFEFEDYMPQDDDYVEIVVHSPYTKEPTPYV